MTKPITTWIKYVVLCAVMIGGALGAEAARYIYYWGKYNGFPQPIESNSSRFNGYRLFETADGSNIYRGTLTPNNYFYDDTYATHSFNFYTKLASDEDYENGLNEWFANCIVPTDDYVEDLSIDKMSAKDAPVAYRFNIINTPYFAPESSYRPRSWHMLQPGKKIAVTFTVDLNNNTVDVAFDVNVLVVNDIAKPTIDNINDYPYNGRHVYVPAGECSFRAYNPARDKYYSLSEPMEVMETSVILSEASGALCTVPNWGGGTLSINGNEVKINNLYQSLNDGGTTAPVIPKFTGIVLEQQDMFVDLSKVAPSKVGVNNLTTFTDVEKNGKYQFTIDGAMNRPFRFLEFKDDKLVKVYQPATDMTLLWVGDTAHGSISKSTDAAPAYWTSEENGETTVTIDPTADDINAITFTMPSLTQPGKIYLVGTMNDWAGPEVYTKYPLLQTDDNKYYGAFYLESGLVQLKFLRDLDWWNGATPIGSYYNSKYSFSGETLSIRIGTYADTPNIKFYWDGGIVYMLLDELSNQLLLSKEPIDVTYYSGNPTPPDGLLLIDNTSLGETRYEATEVSEGVYRVNLKDDYKSSSTHHIKLFRRKHTFADNEPAFLNSYTLTFADTKLKAGDDGIAETSFTFNDGVNAGPGNEIEIDYIGLASSDLTCYYITVDFNTGKIYFDNNRTYYIVPSADGPKKPTYATRAEFADYCVNRNGVGVILDFPAGEVSLTRTTLHENAMGGHPVDTAEATFDSDGVAKTNWLNQNDYPEEVTLHNCPGGKIFFGYHATWTDYDRYLNFYLIALDKVNSFDVCAREYNPQTRQDDYTLLGRLALTDPATRTFSGRATVPTNRFGDSQAVLTVNGDSDLYFGGALNGVTIDPATKTAEYDIDPRYLTEYLWFKNVDNHTVDISVSLASMKGSLKLIEGDILDIYDLNINQYSSQIKREADSQHLKKYIDVSWMDEVSINLSAPDGSIIVPANGDTEMTFDDEGVFTDDFVVIKSPSEAMRRAPIDAARWRYKAHDDYYDYLTFDFDLENNKVKVISDLHNNKCYAIAAPEDASVTELEDVRPGELKPNGDGTLSAKVHIAPGEKLYIVHRRSGAFIRDGAGYGLYPQLSKITTIDFNSEHANIAIVPNINWYTYGWTIENNPGCDAVVTYDPANLMLHIDMALAGVEDVAIDDNSSDAAPVYYNLQGVRITNPESGHIYIEVRGNKARKILK